MKILFLGARVQDLGGFQGNELQHNIKANIVKTIEDHQKAGDKITVLTGLSLGIETWAAVAANDNDAEFHVYIPFDDPQNKWPKKSQMEYLYLLKKATKKTIVDTGPFEAKKLFEKEIRMITDADKIYTFFPTPHPSEKLLIKLKKEGIDLMPKGEQDDEGIPF